MKFYSNETMRLHAQDLTKELEVKQIDATLRYFIINAKDRKTSLPMYDLAARQAREWSAVGVLDLHDLAQECYCALIKSYGRVKWDVINASDNPKASLWAFLKKSVKLDVRMAINTFKDGMRIPHYKIWEAKTDKYDFKLDNFFSVPMPNMWFWENDEELNYSTESITRFDIEQLYDGLQNVMRDKLNDTERLILEMSFGIDEHQEKPRSYKDIAEFFNMKESNIRKIKQRALKKMRSKEIEEYLNNYYEFGSQP